MSEIKLYINSYVTLEQANNYIEYNYPTVSNEYKSWFNDSLSDNDKVAMLIQSANSLNNLRYTGTKIRVGQPLAFPRVKRYGIGPAIVNTYFISQYGDNSLVDKGGGDNGLVVIGYAQIENALAYAAINKSKVSSIRENRLSGLVSERAGSVTRSFNIDNDDYESGIYSKKVYKILKAWITETVYAL